MTLVFTGTNDVAFLGGSGSAVDATISDLSSGSQVYVASGGNDTFSGLSADTSSVVHLLAGVGGPNINSVTDIMNALQDDGHSGTSLTLGTGSIDFAGVPIGQLHASNFRIG